jgi:hypothetical protein
LEPTTIRFWREGPQAVRKTARVRRVAGKTRTIPVTSPFAARRCRRNA